MSFFEKHRYFFVITISVILYYLFAYFLERTQFYTLCFLWFSLFGSFYLLVKNKDISFATLVGVALLFRLIFLFAIPNLSQDFYRFIWDGRMILNGFNPYLSLPKTFVQQNLQPIAETAALYEGMGALNGSNYTNYPPLNQLCFFMAAVIAKKSIFGAVIILRVLIILADIGILYFGKRVLKHLNLPVKNIFWYLLNPLVIIEMTGNLHFEPVMLFFLVWAFYKLLQQKWIWAAFLLACAISVKLIPLLFLPLFFQWFVKPAIPVNKGKEIKNNSELTALKKGWFPDCSDLKKLLLFYTTVLAVTLLLFLPFYTPELITNYFNSIGLWFHKFEFNGSFYYVLREIGYAFSGYNEIAFIGKITSTLTLLYIVYLSFFRKNKNNTQLFTTMLLGLCFYYFTASTVHPWYIATPLILCIFTTYRFPIVWSLMIILTYQAYENNPWEENLWFIFVEYLVVFSFLIYDFFSAYKKKKL